MSIVNRIQTTSKVTTPPLPRTYIRRGRITLMADKKFHNCLFAWLCLMRFAVTLLGHPLADTEDESDAVLQLSPSPYATAVLYEPLSFFCSANDSSYLMLWSISYFDEPYDLEAEVTFFNSSSTLLINTTTALNESVITCSVQEEVNQPYIYSQSTTILTQGLLPSVVNLTCTVDGPCSWEPPFTLEGTEILQYDIIVGQVDNVTALETSTQHLSWTYCPDEIESYELTVIPVNSLGNGESSSVLGLTHIDSFMVKTFTFSRLPSSNYCISMTIKRPLLSCVHQIEAWVTSNGGNYSYNSSQIKLLEPDTVLVELCISDNMKWIFNAILYVGESNVSTVQKEISTYDVQAMSMTNPELGEVCFACAFVSDTAAVGCLIEYAPTLMLRVERNLTLFRHARKNMAAACVTGIENGTYRVLVYDLEGSGLPSSNPAVVIDSIEIRGLVLHGNVSQDLMSTTPSFFEEESPSLKTSPSSISVGLLLLSICLPAVAVFFCLTTFSLLIIYSQFLARRKNFQLENDSVPTTSVSRLSQEHSSNEEIKSAVYNDAQSKKEQTIRKIDGISYTETLL